MGSYGLFAKWIVNIEIPFMVQVSTRRTSQNLILPWILCEGTGKRKWYAGNRALGLASQTVLKATFMVSKCGKNLGRLKNDVTSPGGTMIADIHELEKNGFWGLLINDVVEAAKHTQELSMS
ncbi:hypothetical protein REPUB_Repub04eG0103400 [Reevesia pubescens]